MLPTEQEGCVFSSSQLLTDIRYKGGGGIRTLIELLSLEKLLQSNIHLKIK